MKKRLQLFAVILLLCSSGFTATAQDETTATVRPHTHIPRWVSMKGYWVVESNVHEPRRACIYFYSNDNTLVHKETINGVKLSVNKSKTKMKLKEALEIAVGAWAAGHPDHTPENLVAALFTK